MRSKHIRMGLLGIVVGVLLSSVVVVLAGSTDSTGPPNAPSGQMYTLEQIYDRLATGAASTKMTLFTEPLAGPAGTGRTLDEVMALAKAQAWLLVNKTGQTESYKAADPWGTCTCGTADCPPGQDGDHEMGIDPAIEPTPNSTTGAYNTPPWTGVRFTDNGDGTVTDNLMGLIWLKDAGCWDLQDWANALANSNALASGQCGLADGSIAGDWRLPNVNELHSLIDLTQPNPPVLPSGHPFDGVESYHYWSSTTDADMPDLAWYVDLWDGRVYYYYKPDMAYVWPVRGGQ